MYICTIQTRFALQRRRTVKCTRQFLCNVWIVCHTLLAELGYKLYSRPKQNKVGVDVFDQTARKYTTHAASRRWPLAVWTKLLDIVELNSWILHRKCFGSKIGRRSFILQLTEGLRDAYAVKRKQVVQREVNPAQRRPSGKRRKCAEESRKII